MKKLFQSILIENEMKSSYIDYSMSVIVSRALPDGLKPVHRSVLYGMYEQGGLNNKIYTMRYTEIKLKKISVGMGTNIIIKMI